MKIKQYLIVSLLIAFFLRLFLSVQIYSGDVNNHIGWANEILQNGPSGVYERAYTTILRPNYPVLTLMSFVSGTGMYKLIYQVATEINKSLSIFPSSLIWAIEDQDVMPAFNKIFSILCDLGIGVLLYYFSRKLNSGQVTSLVISIVYLFTPISWYISALWGQVDSVPIFFILLSLKYIIQRKNISSHITFVLAILSKQIWPVFFPFFCILWLRRFPIRDLFVGFLTQTIIFTIVNLPFSKTLNILWPFTNYLENILFTSGSTYVSDHAFNFWALFSKLEKVSETVVYVANTPSNVFAAFIIGIVTVSLVVKLFLAKKFSEVIYVLTSISLTAFIFLTKMHERHLAYAIPFLLLTVSRSKVNWLFFGLISIVHLINLYHDWYFPRIQPLDTFVASWPTIQISIYLLLISWAYILLSTFLRKR